MFDKSMRRQTAPGAWGRWHPEAFQICSGTLPPLHLASAAIVPDTSGAFPGVYNCRISWTLDGLNKYENKTEWHVTLFFYDDDSGRVISDSCAIVDGHGGVGPEDFKLFGFANMSTYQHIHVYAVYHNGHTGELADSTPEEIGKAVSKTSYIKATPPAAPVPPATAQGGAESPGAGASAETKPQGADEAALLMEESRRLAAEAQRLSDEAKAAETGTT
jgi:hypothetical protein